MKNEGFTLRKRLRSFKFAGNGIRLLITREHNAWIHCFAAVCVTLAGWLIGLSSTEWIAIVFAIGSVLAAEAVNSSIEALADFSFHQNTTKLSSVQRIWQLVPY